MTLNETLRYSMEEETNLSLPVSLDEPLILDQALNLSGDGEAVSFNSERATLRLKGPGPYCFRGLHFQHHYKQAVNLVQVEDALVVFKDCTFSGACGGTEVNLAAAVTILGASRVLFEDCEFHHNDRHLVCADEVEVSLRSCNLRESLTHGLCAEGNAEVNAKELEVSNSGWSGISLEGSASLKMVDSRLHENGCQGLEMMETCTYQGARNLFTENAQNGVVLAGSCSILSDGDQFLGNGMCGLDMSCESTAAIRWGHAAHNKSHGVQARDKSRLDLSDSISCENFGSGIAVFGRASLNGEDLQSEQNQLTGIQGTGEGRVSLSRASVSNNATCGLALYEKCRLTLERSRICDCTGHGLQLAGSSQTLIRDCEITENSRGGVFLTEKAAGVLEGSTLAHNGKDGLAAYGDSRLTAQSSRFHDNGRDGVNLTSSSALILLENICDRNGRYGMFIGEDSEPLTVENSCEANQEDQTFHQAEVSGTMLCVPNSDEMELPFKPEGIEKAMLDALARHGRLSELALGKVARTRRVGGAMENLIHRLNEAGMPIIHHDGQGPEGVVYALKTDTSRNRLFHSEETIEQQII